MGKFMLFKDFFTIWTKAHSKYSLNRSGSSALIFVIWNTRGEVTDLSYPRGLDDYFWWEKEGFYLFMLL